MPLYLNPTNLLAGGLSGLGDNGVGELSISNAATVPTTNPVGGAVLYATGGGIFSRDSGGGVSQLAMPGGMPSTPPAASVAETHHRYTIVGSTQPSSGVLTVMSVSLSIGQKISKLGFCTGSQAAVNPVHWWAALLDSSYVQQAHSADQLTSAIPASTWQLLSVVTPYVTTYTGTYYLAVMVATSAGTQPSILAPSFTPVTQLVTGTNNPGPLLGGQSTSGLTSPGTDGTTTYAAPTTPGAMLYMYATA